MTRLAALRRAIIGLAVVIPLGGAIAAENDSATACTAPPALTRIEPALAHAAARIDQAKALTIVAVGSSSTQGVGATDPSLNYPSRLETALKQLRSLGKSCNSTPTDSARSTISHPPGNRRPHRPCPTP